MSQWLDLHIKEKEKELERLYRIQHKNAIKEVVRETSKTGLAASSLLSTKAKPKFRTLLGLR